MKLRTRLTLAFLLLAVVPLGAITLYSYRSSACALRRTVESESARMAEEMNDRMTGVTAGLSRKIDLLESLPLPDTRDAASTSIEATDPMLLLGNPLPPGCTALRGRRQCASVPAPRPSIVQCARVAAASRPVPRAGAGCDRGNRLLPAPDSAGPGCGSRDIE